MAKQVPVDSPSLRRHKRQFFWQILLPLILLVLVGLTTGLLASLAAFSGRGQTRLWADVSLIWLLAPMLALALVLAIALGFAVYGLARLKKAAPRATTRAQELVAMGANGVRRVADGATQPFVWLEQAGAAVRSAFTFLLMKK